jgi:hypothetical protein
MSAFRGHLVGAGNAGQLAIRLELVNGLAKGTSPAVGLWRRFSFDGCREWCRPFQGLLRGRDTGQAIGHADSTGDLAAADGNGSRRWS